MGAVVMLSATGKCHTCGNEEPIKSRTGYRHCYTRNVLWRRRPRQVPATSLPTDAVSAARVTVAGWSARPVLSPAPAGPARFYLTGADGDAVYHDRRRAPQPVPVDRRQFTDDYRAGVHAALTLAGRGAREHLV